VLAPGCEDEAGAQGVVELPPGVVQRRSPHAEPVDAQDPDRDPEQEQQLNPAAAAGLDPDGVGDRGGVAAGELPVGGEEQPVPVVGEVGERVEASQEERLGGRWRR
jgi:hypothetical protein